MNELLSTGEDSSAAAQGWSLSHVYDMTPGKWHVMVLPAVFGSGASAEGAAAFVIDQARAGSALAQKALRLVVASHTPTAQAKKKGKKK